jgi:hypothetical protein
MAIVIVGVGIVALITCLGAGSKVNGAGRDLTQAVFLAQEMREWTVQLPFSDANLGTTLSSLYVAGGATYPLPKGGDGNSIANMPGWSQVLTLSWRDPNNLLTTVSPNTSTVINVQVSARMQGVEVFSTNWIVAKRN